MIRTVFAADARPGISGACGLCAMNGALRMGNSGMSADAGAMQEYGKYIEE